MLYHREEYTSMISILPIIAIAAIFVFTGTHAALTPKKEKKKSAGVELGEALEKLIKESRGTKDDSK